MESFEKLQYLVKSFDGRVEQSEMNSVLDCLDSLRYYTRTLSEDIIRYIDVNHIDPSWAEIWYGHFGYVYASRYRGSKVAIKIFKENTSTRSKIQEGKILYSLSHENIVAFRGIGYISEMKGREL